MKLSSHSVPHTEVTFCESMSDEIRVLFVRCDMSYDSDAKVNENHLAPLQAEAVEGWQSAPHR